MNKGIARAIDILKSERQTLSDAIDAMMIDLDGLDRAIGALSYLSPNEDSPDQVEDGEEAANGTADGCNTGMEDAPVTSDEGDTEDADDILDLPRCEQLSDLGEAEWEACYEAWQTGASVSWICERVLPGRYNQFSVAFKVYRETRGEDPDPEQSEKPAVKDPDRNREDSGWTFADDIHLLDQTKRGVRAGRIAGDLGGVSAEDVMARLTLLAGPHPKASLLDKVLAELRLLLDRENAAMAAE